MVHCSTVEEGSRGQIWASRGCGGQGLRHEIDSWSSRRLVTGGGPQRGGEEPTRWVRERKRREEECKPGWRCRSKQGTRQERRAATTLKGTCVRHFD
jgi:hypothetical protein